MSLELKSLLKTGAADALTEDPNPASGDYTLTWDATTDDLKRAQLGNLPGGGGGGTSIALDLGDDGANESTELTEIATTGDVNSIFTEPGADKLLIDVTQNWPTADVANALAADALDAITEIASALRSGSDGTLITGTAGTSGNLAQWNADGDAVDSSIAVSDVLIDTDIAAGAITAAPGALDLSGGSDGHVLTKQADGSLSLEAVPAGGSTAINDLTDVTITTPADNEVLAFDNGTSEWINQTAAEAGLAAASHNHTLADVTDSGALAALDTVGTAQIDNAAVTYAKMQDVSATNRLLGRSTAGAGDVEEIVCTAAGRALIDDADASAQRTTLGLAIGSDVQAWDADLDTWATKTPPSGAAVGTTDTQTLTGKTLDNTNSIEAEAIDSGTLASARLSDNQRTTAIEFVIDGGGSAITTGVKGDIEVPFACTIQQVTMLADQSTTTTVDIWKDTYANFPPTDADSITAAAVPGTSAALKDQDATLTGWTTSISAGDILRFNVDANDNAERVTVSLEVLVD